MKKLLQIILLIIVTCTFSVAAMELPDITEHEKVTIYLFRGNGCPHCSHAEEFFKSLGNEYKDYFSVVSYEVWYNEENADLATKVADNLGDKFGGVPYIVIGNGYHEAGYAESMSESIIKAALEEYKNDNYTDVVVQTKAINKMAADYEIVFGNFVEPDFNIKKYHATSKVNISDVKNILSGFSFFK